MCDPFVFNTVITRAQSLVVCVGNPYFLCHLENIMKSRQRCWATYIKCCFDYETFSCRDKDFSRSAVEILQNTLHINQARLFTQTFDAGDKIVKGYLESLAQFEEHKKALKFSKKWGDIQWEESDQGTDSFEGCYSEEDDDSFTETQIKCYIYFQSRYSAVARPLKNPNRAIYINGQGNLQGAFHESKVLVEPIDDNLNQSRENKAQVTRWYGKVVKLLHPLENPLFLCEVDSVNPSRFYPINKKDPMFYNLPFLSKTVNGVAMFNLNALSTGSVPRIVHVFPPEIAWKRIFVIRYLCWNSLDYKFPVGVVVDSISKGFTFSAGERLLRIQYSFDYTEPIKIFKPLKHTEKHKAESIFAISQKSIGAIENAFSIRVINKNVYCISFYVVNAAKSIEDEELFESIEKCGVSAHVKTDKLHQWKSYSMFPSKVLSELQFVLNEPRHCFSVSCEVEINNGNVNYKPLDNPTKEVVGVLTRTFSDHEVENMIENQSQFTDISVLFQVAQCLQFKRLGYYEAVYNCNRLLDPSESPCTQLILKEFSLWANRLVAIKLCDSLFSFPLYCKLPFSEQSKQMVYKEHGMALQTSVHNKYYLPRNGYKQLPNVIINDQVLSLLLESLKNDDIFKYLSLLAYDNCFPQLCVATHQFQNIKQVHEFVTYTQDDDVDFNNFSHEATEYTTMFTSPLTNYFDIVVQSMLSSALDSKQHKYDLAELQAICEKANRDLQRKLEFENDVFNLQLGVTLKAFNQRIVGYVEKINDKNQLTLSFPSYELEKLSEHQSSFNIAHLFAVKGSGGLARASTSVYEWKVKVASLMGPPSIFTSSNVFTLSSNDKLQGTSTAVDITLFLADRSEEDKESQFFVELEKKQLKGKLKSSTVSVSQKEWNQLTGVMLNPNVTDSCQTAIRILSRQKTVPMQKESFKLEADQTVFWSGTVKMQMHSKYDMLHVWFGAAQDTALIYPKIQQVEIVPFLKVCVQHNAEPEKCFTDVTLTNATRDYYRDIKEYIELWGQVVIAENAVSSVNTRDVLLLENVYLQWPALEYCGDSYVGDYYRIPEGEYVTMTPPLDFIISSIELFNLSRGDLLCVQYEETDKKHNLQMGFVFRMIVHKVEVSSKNESDDESNDSDSEISTDDNGDNKSTESYKISEIKYYLKCAEGATKVSEVFKNVLRIHNPKCLVQILHIQPPQRLLFILYCLHKFCYKNV